MRSCLLAKATQSPPLMRVLSIALITMVSGKMTLMLKALQPDAQKPLV